MNTDFRVAEVGLTYKNRVPSKDRKEVLDSRSAYSILREIYSDDTIDYREGGITDTMADVRMILQGALLTNATGIILAHNHPSGTLKPSREDDRLTRRIVEAADIMNIRVNDHIILTSEGFYSYDDEGRI